MKSVGTDNTTRSARRPEWRYGGVVALSLVLSMLVVIFHPLSTAEWYVIDMFARWHHNSSRMEASVAVVLIDDEVVDKPQGWPIKKNVYEGCALYLMEMGASAVAFDVLFTDDLECGDTGYAGSAGDEGLLRTTALNGNLIFAWGAYVTDRETGTVRETGDLLPFIAGSAPECHNLTAIAGAQLPYPRLLKNVRAAGFLNRGHVYIDNVERRMPLVAAFNDTLLQPSLALAAVMQVKGIRYVAWQCDPAGLLLDGRKIPCDKRGEMLLDFKSEIPTCLLSDVYESMDQWRNGERPDLDSSEFNGRIVFIGNGAISLQDFGVTPLGRKNISPFTPNVLLHARSAATLIAGNPPECISLMMQLLVIFCIIGLLVAIRFMLPDDRRFTIVAILFILLPPVAACLLYTAGLIVFPLTLSLSAGIYLLCDFIGANSFNVHPADTPRAYNGDKPFVFISYKHEELREALGIMFQLQAMGCRIWYDRAIKPGEEWKRVLETKIRQSKSVIFIASPLALCSSEVQDELCKAMDAQKNIIPVCINREVYKYIYRKTGASEEKEKRVIEYCRYTHMVDMAEKNLKHTLKMKLQDMKKIPAEK